MVDKRKFEPLDRDEEKLDEHTNEPAEEKEPNPPRTKSGPMVAPKFGSAGSGGAELEPGPKRP